MIKRLFYKQDHGEKDASSSSDDDDSDSTPEVEEEEEEDDVEEEEEEEEEEGEEIGGAREDKEPLLPSSGSGYESEDSSGNEVDGDSSGLLASEEKDGPERDHENPNDGQLNDEVDVGRNENVNNTRTIAIDSNDPIQADLRSCILKCKSVFKCKLCPRIVCLNEKIVRQHLKSKRHARSKKLFGEGRLKLMLNSDGEIEEEQETHAERHARIIALAQEVVAPKRKDTGRQRQSCRRKKRLRNRSETGKPEQLAENPTKRKRKAED